MEITQLPIHGKTLSAVTKNGVESIDFDTTDGERYRMQHIQDCCETVEIEDVCGDLDDLIGVPLLMAEEVEHASNETPDECIQKHCESFTWTFYKFGTVKGYVTIRWFGESNGHYSESVSFDKIRSSKDAN